MNPTTPVLLGRCPYRRRVVNGKSMNVTTSVLFGILLLFCGTQLFAAEKAPRHALTLGIFTSQGDYGERQPTTLLALPLGYKLNYGAWSLRLATALVGIQGPGNVDVASVPDSEPARTQAEVGMGDVFASASRVVLSRASNLWWEPYIKVKIPTADSDKGLGTGEMDVEAGTELSRQIGALTSVFAKFFHRWRGDPPEIALDDGVGASVGMLRSPRPIWKTGLVLDYRQASAVTTAATREITVFGTRKLSAQKNVTFYALAGLSDASPDVGAGLQFQWTRP